MDARTPNASGRLAIIGAILVLGGIAALILPRTGWDVETWIEGSGWPIFVIVPGLLLWALAFVPRPPAGVGFAIAGSIVTAVGLLLWYQQLSGNWDSWAYAWALIGPCAAGVGVLLYGLMMRIPRMVSTGLWLAAIGFGLFVVGALYFETVFRTGRVPFDVDQVWPFIVIGVGVALVLGTFREGRSTRRHP